MPQDKSTAKHIPIWDPAYVRRIDPIWMPGKAPFGFWNDEAHQRDYVLWLGHKLRFRRLEDWYKISYYDFLHNKGLGVVMRYHCSPSLAVTTLIPRADWCEWMFLHVPPGFWNVVENQHRYLRWLGKELGYRKPKDWYQISIYDITDNYGDNLLTKYHSLFDLMRRFMPQLDWDLINPQRPIRVEQVLQWLDEYYAQHGDWPTSESGPIAGTNLNWSIINDGFRHGHHGMPGGSSLSKFLEQYKGVKRGRTPPPLSEEQIIAWADAYFAANGKWPTIESGAVLGSRETWRNISSALSVGIRGLPGGSSLPQLLAKHRGARNHRALPKLKEHQIIGWAKAHFASTGSWPSCGSGSIIQSPGDTWNAIDISLTKGRRGLPGGSSLYQLLKKHGLKQ
jgi:hypothetical protein